MNQLLDAGADQLLDAEADSPPANSVHLAIGMPAGWTIAEWCNRWKFSQPFYFKMKRQGKGPKTLSILGRMQRITPEAEREWLAARQAETAAAE